MGVKVRTSTGPDVWKTVTLPSKYSTDGGTTWYSGKRLSYLDPVTGNYMRGVWGDLPPDNIVNPQVAYTWNGSAYTMTATWAQVSDLGEGDFVTLEWSKAITGGATTTGSVAYSSLTHPGGITTFNYGVVSDIGWTELTFSFRIIDSEGQSGGWVAATAQRVPPGIPTSVAINPVWNGTRYSGRVTWSAPAGTVASYRVVWTRNGGAGGTINGATSPTDLTSGVVGGDLLSATVYAIDGLARVSAGVTVTMRTPPDQSAGISLSGMNTPTATLSWSPPSAGAYTGFRWRYSTDGGTNFSGWTNVGSATLSASIGIVGVSYVVGHVEVLNSPSTPQTNSMTIGTANTYVVPPTPSVNAPTFANSGTITVTWGGSTTNVAYYDVYFAINGGGWVRYGAGLAPSTTSFAANVGLSNNTTQQALVYAYHSNGQNAGASASAVSPSQVSTPTCRFSAGSFYVTWTHLAGNSGYSVYIYRASDNAQIDAVGLGVQESYTSPAGAYAEWTSYYVVVYGTSGSGYAAGTVGNSHVRKLPNPITVLPVDSETWRNGVDRNVTYCYQGDGGGGVGANCGTYYYSTRFYDYLNSSINGYQLSFSSAYMFLSRMDGIGTSAAIPPVLGLHTKGAQGEGNPLSGFGGGVALPIWLTRPANSPPSGPYYANEYFEAASILDWIYYLRDQTNGWKGLCLYTTSTTYYGMFQHYANCGGVVIYHDG